MASMNDGFFSKHLRSGNPRPVYLFKGDAALLTDQAWKDLLEALARATGAPDIRGERISAKEIPAHEVVARLRTLSLFVPVRAVFVRDVEAWTGSDREALYGYLENPNPRACLVLHVEPRKSWKKLEECVRRHGEIVEIKSVTERQLPAWIRDRARAYGKRMSVQTAGLMAARLGSDLRILDSELEKLALYVGDREEVRPEDVERVISRRHTESVFRLMDYVGEKRLVPAFRCLRGLLMSGEAPLSVLALLTRQIRLVWQVKDGLQRGETVATLARRFRLPNFVVEKYARQARRFSEDTLHALHGAVLETDVRLKTTALDPERALESLIYRFCR